MTKYNKVLVLGASGATGKLVVQKLNDAGITTKIVVRETATLPKEFTQNKNIEIIRANILDLDYSALSELIQDCDSVISCLGHNITLKGIYGNPRMLVADAIHNICETIIKNGDHKYKILLMNTVGNQTSVEFKKLPIADRIIISILKWALPPYIDNVRAADYLINNIGDKNPFVEWVAVRPDSLINEDNTTAYKLHHSPTRSPIFNSGKTSRINVADFMSRLIQDNELWNTWKTKMPVIYNQNN